MRHSLPGRALSLLSAHPEPVRESLYEDDDLIVASHPVSFIMSAFITGARVDRELGSVFIP